jgi:hypothetical protein
MIRLSRMVTALAGKTLAPAFAACGKLLHRRQKLLHSLTMIEQFPLATP